MGNIRARADWRPNFTNQSGKESMQKAVILLVEDDANDEELILRALKGCSFAGDVHVARDGQEAVDYVSSDAAPPNLIILDLKLPKMGGLEVLQAMRLQNRTRLIPVVVFTSSVEQTDVLASYDLGVNSYVRKPVDYQEFNETIRLLVKYWVDLNVPVPEERRRLTRH